ncbi:MAG: SDR family oxidoreductase [Anaerolineaceae bacterium]|jgi:putative NADH-flavin reductase|nr:SDR family oxidoreductase [Anaerolineaceae bacterium]
MKLLILGASGRTGQHLVKQALAAGHQVTALVRTPEKLDVKDDALTIVQGDVTDAAAVTRAVAGNEVVLSALGPTRTSSDDMLQTAIGNTIAAMQENSMRRVIVVTGAGVSDPNDNPQFWNRIMSGLLNLLAKRVLADSLGAANLLRASDLDWTLVRVPVLTDDPSAGEPWVGYVGKGMGSRIPRADVAAFMLKQVADDTWVRKSPVITSQG